MHFEEERQDVVLKTVYHSILGAGKVFRVHSNPFGAQGGIFAQLNPFDYCLLSCAGGLAENLDCSEEFDPSRMPPRLFLKDPVRLAAIRTEIDGLLQKGKGGIYPLEVIGMRDPRAKTKKARATMVVKWKGALKAKARLCVRGDLLQSKDAVSPPTPYRSSIRTTLMIGAAGRFSFYT